MELFVGSDLASIALRVLKRFKRKVPLDAEEEFAVERLCSWLSKGVGEDLPSPLESLLDDSQRAYLLSFRDRSDGFRRQYVVQCLLDAAEWLSNPQLQTQLRLLEDWERFDVFEVARLTDGRPLQTVGLNLLRKRGLIAKLRLADDKLRSFLQAVEGEYHPNPYHSSMHAADVTQALAAMLSLDGYACQLSDLELLALLVSAMIHDVGHPGVTNDFLIRTSSEAALQYNDQSINENMHLAMAFKLLLREEHNFLVSWGDSEYRYFRRLVVKIVLATDMAGHKGLVEEFTAHVRLWGGNLAAWPEDKRVVALQMLLHSADISNPARPVQRCSSWGQKVHEEFFLQGDRERSLGLPVSLMCDRSKASVPKNQRAFIEFVVKPSLSVLADLAPKFVAKVMPNVEASVQHWQQLLDADVSAEANASVTAAAPVQAAACAACT
ncbi:hypothetical protein N2152v2_009020 [Parachlorella kessleri]